jgi:O-antigen ligase
MLVVYGSTWLTVCTIWTAFTRRRTIQILALAIAINGTLLAALGIAQRFIPTREIFWLWTPPPGAAIFASFVYKNHAGAYLFLAVVMTCGLAAWYYLRGLRRMEKSNPSGLFAFLASCIAISIVVSYARGATLTTLAFLSVVLVGFIVAQVRGAKQGTRRPGVLIVMLILFGVFVSTGYHALRFGESWQRIARGLSGGGGDASFHSRMVANHASADMLRENWVRGIGSGSFSFLFPAYQQNYPEIWTFPGAPNRRQYWSHAHNDVLQIPNELGLAGMLLIAAGWLYWLVTLTRRYFWANPLSLILVAGAILFVGYSYFDFPFYCPAVLMLWCCMWPIAAIWAKLEEAGGR